jgi:hypothetical protein
MRLVFSAPRPIRALSSAFCVLALVSCTRDLALPSPPTSPTIAGFTPLAAYAGQLVRVSGTHFALEATGNTVNFAHASARGERWDGAALVIRVPADAGDGAVTVTSREGTSAASTSAFDYLGLGEPRRIQVAASNPILHRPAAVHAIGGDVVLHSGLYAGLVWAGSSAFSTPTITRSAADPTLGTLFYADSDPSLGTPRLVSMDATSGSVIATAALDYAPAQILPLPGDGVVLTFHWNDLASVEEVAAWDATSLAPVFAPAEYGVASFFGAADVGDGRVVIAGVEPAAYEFTLLVLGIGAALPGPPAPALAAPTPPSISDTSSGLAALAVGRAAEPNLVAGIATGDHLAAVALYGGDIAVANLDAPSPVFEFTVETWSTAAIETIAASPTGGTFGAETGIAIATKTGDDLSIGFNLATGRLLWGVVGSKPTVATVDGPLAFVANDGDNDVSVINLTTGSRVARVNFDVLPGAQAGFAGAAAFVPAASGIDGDILFPSTAFPGLLRFPTGTGETASVSRAQGIAFLSAAIESRTAWASSWSLTPRVEGYLDGSWDAPVSVDLPPSATPRIAAARGHLLVVGHDAGLSLVNGDTGTATTATVPGAGAPVFRALGFTPTGEVWALVEGDLDVQAQLWSPASITTGGTPTATWTVPGFARTAAFLEDGLWVFQLDAALLPVATLLDGTMSEVRTVSANERLLEIHAVSPNGRLLVHREMGGTLGYLLRFFRADPAAGFPEVQTLVFDARVEGFTFDATGERLFVLTQAPDRVVTVD